MKRLIKPFLFTSFIFSQYPSDTLFVSTKASAIEKILIYPITKWQRISYGSPGVNCQFYPSCSQYSAIAIHDKGPLIGLFATSDRIIRCNQSAYQSHVKIDGEYYKDGRMIDMLNHGIRKDAKSPIFAGILSIIPGLGRIYSNRTTDGFFGFLLTSVAYQTAKRSIDNKSILSPFFIASALILHGGEIYGAYRTAKYYHPPKKLTE